MSLNWQEIDQVLAEWNLEGAQLQNVVQPDFHSLLLEFFTAGTTQWLQICLEAGMTRLHRIPAPPRTKGTQPRFAEFLRARFKGGTVSEMRQLGCDRIIVMAIDLPTGRHSLYIRLWGNAANILAVSPEGQVLDALYRRPAKGEVTGASHIVSPIRNPSESDRLRFPVRSWPASDTPFAFNDWLAGSYRDYSRNRETEDLKARLTRVAEAARARLTVRKDKLERQLNQNSRPERLRELGEMILAQSRNIRKGQEWFETDDWYTPGTRLRIELDPRLDAVANAERYFQRFQKARDGRRFLEEDLAKARADLAALDRLAAELPDVSDPARLRELAAGIDAHAESGGPSREGNERPGLTYQCRGFTVFIGRTAAENDALLRRHVRGNDWWLHVRDHSGGYVFIKVPKTKSVPLDVLLDAAHLAIWYSKARAEPVVDLFYTQVKYLRRAKHGTFGMVIPTLERNLHVQVDPERHKALAGALNPDT